MNEHPIYDQTVLELAGNIPRVGRLERPDATATAHSRLCGSTVTVDLAINGDRVVDYAHEVRACALGQAAASAIAGVIVGASFDEIDQSAAALRAMLKENGDPPVGRFARLAVLQPARDYRARHAAILLCFDAIQKALEEAGIRTSADPQPVG